MVGTNWIDSEVEALKALWPTDASCVSIGEQINRSRLAVSNKAKRCGLRPRHQQAIWKDPSIVETLIRLWKSGLSATEIRLQEGWTFSRCAILGKLHRLGLLGGRHHVWRRPVNKPRKVRKPRQSITIFTIPVESLDDPLPADRISFIDLKPWQCKYPFGEGPFMFCGRPQHYRSYCLTHARHCYRNGS